MAIELKRLFIGLQKELSIKLEVNRENIPHPGTKGDASELNWLGMLQNYLPARYQVEKAFVLDSDGNLSDQIDIVVFDRHYCPLLFNQDGAIYIPAESVYAVFEVKQGFNKEVIDYAANKVASVRKLRRTSVAIPHAGGVYAPKQPFRILGGILALDSDWIPGLGTSLFTALCEQQEEWQLDLGCSLLHGSFEILYPENDAPRFEQSEQETSLIFFFLRLLQRLQQLGTVPAIDLREYGKNL
jgi:hypothetical protein